MRSEDLINIGAYVAGSNPKIDHAITMMDSISQFLRQGIDERVAFEQMLDELRGLFKKG